MRRLATVFIAFGLLFFALPAIAQDGTIEISIDGVVRGAEGEVVEVASQAVDPELVGAECSAVLTVANNNSAHPNNDLIITTGDDEGVIPDVEAVEDVTLTFDGTLTLGDTITVSLRFGPNGVSSGGLVLTLTCSQVAETTTTTVAETTTTVAETTTTTEAAPVGGVETGAGGTADTENSSLPLVALGGGIAISLGALAVRIRQTRTENR